METTHSSVGFSWIQLRLFYANKTFNNHAAQKATAATGQAEGAVTCGEAKPSDNNSGC